MRTRKILRAVVFTLVLPFALVIEPDPGAWIETGLLPSAEARLGRPATPGSVAGVARRTTRRAVRRTAVYVATLPRGCPQVYVNGMAYYSCGGVYYEPSGSGYVVVVID